MAWIGLKTPGSTTGTSMAGDLAKALLGDPTDVMNAAKTRSALETDEYQRRLIREQIAEHQINALKLGQERAREHDAWLKRYAAAPGLKQFAADALVGAPAQPVVAEEPVPVELVSGGGGGVPEHLRNFDERHQPIVAAPLRLPATGLTPGYEPPAEVPVEVGEITDSFLARRGQRGVAENTRRNLLGELSTPTSPLAVRGDRLGEPVLKGPRLGTPDLPDPRLTAATEPTGPRLGEPVLKADRLGEPTLKGDRLGVPSLVAEEPVPVDTLPSDEPVPLLAGDPRLADTPIDQAGESKLGAPVTALLEGDPRLNYDQPVPVEMLQPQPPPPDTMPTATIEPPLPIGEEATPAPVAEQAAASAAPPAAAPSQAPVDAPAKTKITVKGVDDGKHDTAAVVQTAKIGPMPREKVDAIIDYIMLNAENPEQGMQAVQRFVGSIGAMYNPSFGPGGDERITENLASLRQGGAALGRESVLGEPSAIRVAKASGGVKTLQGKNGLHYEVATDPATGQTTMTLIPGQERLKASLYPETETGKLMEETDKLALRDPKTWSREEAQFFSSGITKLYQAQTSVSSDGTITITGGNVPPGQFEAGTGIKVVPGTGATPPATAEPPPTTAEPGTTAPAAEPPTIVPASVEPGTTAPAAPTTGAARQDKHGNYVYKRGDTDVTSLGGYLAPGQPEPPPRTQTIKGVPITKAAETERTEAADTATEKKFSFIEQALPAAKYFKNIKPEQVPGVSARIWREAWDGTTLQALINADTTSQNDREYYSNLLELVKDLSHRDSGADVTASDMKQYRGLFDLPAGATEKDIAMNRARIMNAIRIERTSANNAMPSDRLRNFDYDVARNGLDYYDEGGLPAKEAPGELPPKPEGVSQRQWEKMTPAEREKWNDL